MSNKSNQLTRLRLMRLEDRSTPATFTVSRYDVWDKDTSGTLP